MTCVLPAIAAALASPRGAYAQPREKPGRYEMMLRALGEADTSRAARENPYSNQQNRLSEQYSAQEGAIDPANYTLGPGDALTLTIWGQEFLTVTLTVLPEGGVIVPNIGEKKVANLTLAAAQDSLAKLVSPVFRNARVSLSLAAMRRFKVYCMGWTEYQHAIIASPLDRISDIVERAGGFTTSGTAYLRRIRVAHQDGTSQEVDLYPYYLWGDIAADPYVRDGDAIHVTVMNSVNTIRVYGEVGAPAEFQYARGDSLSTALRMAQGLLPSADVDSIEISRFSADGTSSEHFYVNARIAPQQESKGDFVAPPANLALDPGDRIFVRALPRWHVPRTVSVEGEVEYPGNYSLDNDSTTLTDIIARVHGFTREADLADAELIRKAGTNIIDREFERLQKMTRKEMSDEEYQYFKAKSIERPGVVVVNFRKLFAGNDSKENIVLRDGDSIYVPHTRNYIIVIGSVNNPGRITYSRDLTYQDYIQRAGGYGFRSDRSGVRVINAQTGEVFDPRDRSNPLEAGETIMVPETTETDLWPTIIQAVQVLGTLAGILLGVYAITR